MAEPVRAVRHGEYATRGDYHRDPASDWEYYPTYRAKLRLVRAYLDSLPACTRVLDAGCGEGILVEEYARRLEIQGLDPHYASAHVTAGTLTDLPFPDGEFARVLCLDVLEHLSYADQERALAEIRRVLATDGEALVSVPNLAHLQSRVHFLLAGRFIRTASPHKHPGDRPLAEYERLMADTGFRIVARHGIFPTVPILTRLIRRRPRALEPLHRALTALLPVPGWCFLVVLRLRKAAAPAPARPGP